MPVKRGQNRYGRTADAGFCMRRGAMDKKKENLILIGFMGAGKTSLGKAAAKALAVPFLDTDDLITEREQMPITEIFARKGEEWFRALETLTLRELMDREGGFVLSVGGGLPLREENRVLLRQLGTVVYLKCGVDTLEERLRGDTKRPLLQRGQGTLREKIAAILDSREPLYQEAAHVVMVNDGRTFREAVNEIAGIIKREREAAIMIRQDSVHYREHMRDGRGTVEIHDILTKEELNGHGRLYARMVLPAGASIGWHIHEGETEPFYILKGEGTFIDNDHVAHTVHPGDVCMIAEGEGHSMENNSDSDLEFMALIYYV